MINLDFESPKNREQSLLNFKSLLKHPGWLLVEAIVNANIDIIRNQIIDGMGDEETKEQIDRLRDKLKAYKDIINTPTFWIEKLEPAEPSTYNEDDPYTTIELEEKNKK